MQFIWARTRKHQPPKISKDSLVFLTPEKTREIVIVKFIGRNILWHWLLPGAGSINQFAKYIAKSPAPQMEVDRW